MDTPEINPEKTRKPEADIYVDRGYGVKIAGQRENSPPHPSQLSKDPGPGGLKLPPIDMFDQIFSKWSPIDVDVAIYIFENVCIFSESKLGIQWQYAEVNLDTSIVKLWVNTPEGAEQANRPDRIYRLEASLKDY